MIKYVHLLVADTFYLQGSNLLYLQARICYLQARICYFQARIFYLQARICYLSKINSIAGSE